MKSQDINEIEAVSASADSASPEGTFPQPASLASTKPVNVVRSVGTSLVQSLVAVLVGSLILRLAAQTTGQMLQFYFVDIDTYHYSLSYTIRGFVTASFFIAELLGSAVLGALSDRYGRRIFIILGPVFGAVAVLMTSVTVVLWILVITRLLEGLSTASSVPSTLGYISEVTRGRPKLRARVAGLFELTLVGGIALGATVGGYLYEHFRTPVTITGIHIYSPAFGLNAAIYLVSLAIFVWGVRDIRRRSKPEKPNESKTHHYLVIAKSPRVLRFVPAWLSVFSIIGIWTNHSVGLFTGTDTSAGQLLMGAFSRATFGNGLAVLAVIFAGGILVWSFFLGGHRRTNAMLISMIGMFMTLGSAYGLNHLSSFESGAYYLLMALMVVGIVILSGFTPAALTYLADITEAYAEDRGSIMGLYSVFLGVGQIIGITAGGFFASWRGIDGLLLLSGIFAVITLITLVLLHRSELK